MNIEMPVTLTITLIAGVLVVYHHVAYPLLLRWLAGRNPFEAVEPRARAWRILHDDDELPTVAIVVPAFNEAEHIVEKLNNLAVLDYPHESMQVIVACDGCTDNTAELARQAAEDLKDLGVHIEVRDFEENRGKTNLLNHVIGWIDADIVALSDVSALVSVDALMIAAAHFEDPDVGVVSGTYRMVEAASQGEEVYWKYQTAIKQREAALGATMGVHGAFYLFRRKLFTPLPQDTINDDFILPMKIVEKGYRAAYEPRINALELEVAEESTEVRRRRRIAAGNAQQLVRMRNLLHPKHGGIAFSFASGKALRVMMPFCLLAVLIGSALLAPAYALFKFLLIAQLVGYGSVLLFIVFGTENTPGPMQTLIYLCRGHAASFMGVVRYSIGMDRGGWRRANLEEEKKMNERYVHPVTLRCKRAFDLVVASLALLVFAPLFPLIALIIKVDSKGPVFFKQQRIGRAYPDYVELFDIIKFRSMVQDAEAKTGAVWAQKNDPRITPVGKFLRKTRLDELPQLLNVIKGEMSIVGPRPERPTISRNLEEEIPFFVERTYGLQPGITGMAQIFNGYDETIEDARMKAGWDHGYALALSKPWEWFKTDLMIIFRTVWVMVAGRGQ